MVKIKLCDTRATSKAKWWNFELLAESLVWYPIVRSLVRREIMCHHIWTNCLSAPESTPLLTIARLGSNIEKYENGSKTFKHFTSSQVYRVAILTLPVITNKTAHILVNKLTLRWSMNERVESSHEHSVLWMKPREYCQLEQTSDKEAADTELPYLTREDEAGTNN